MKYQLILYLFCFFLFTNCNKEETIKDNKVTVQFSFVNASGITNANRSYNFDVAKTLVLFSSFEYVDSIGNATKVKDDFLVKQNNTSFKFDVPVGNYYAFRFSFGIDTSLNNRLPMSFPAAHPLSVESGLYWDMLKYRFMVAQGNIDSSLAKNKTPNLPFSMHLGSDTLFTKINVPQVPLQNALVNIQLDLKSLLVLDAEPFRVTNFSNHSESSDIANAVAIKNSFVNNIKVEMSYPK